MHDRGILFLEKAPESYPTIYFNETIYPNNIGPLDICSISRDCSLSILDKPFEVFLEKLAQLEFDSETIFTVIENSTYTREIFDRGINKDRIYLKSWMQLRENKDNTGKVISLIRELLDGSNRSEKTSSNPIIVYNRKGFSETYAKILFRLLDIYQHQHSKKTPY